MEIRPFRRLAIVPAAEAARVRQAHPDGADRRNPLRRRLASLPPSRRIQAHRQSNDAPGGHGSIALLHLVSRAPERLVRAWLSRKERHIQTESTRDGARGLSARRTDRRDELPARTRPVDRCAGDDDDRQPDVSGHGPSHLQRLHACMHLSETGPGRHPADRDRRADGCAVHPVGLRDLLAADALEPAQRQASRRVAVQREERPHRGPRTGRLYARAFPGKRRIRRRGDRRIEDRAARCEVHRRAGPRCAHIVGRARRPRARRFRRCLGVRHHGPVGQELPQGHPHRTRAEEEPAHLRRCAIRWHALDRRRIRQARLRSHRHRHRRRNADGRAHEKQPHPRHPQSLGLSHGAAAHRRIQEEFDGESAGAPACRRDRRRVDGDRYGDRAVRVLPGPGRADSRAVRVDVRRIRRRNAARCLRSRGTAHPRRVPRARSRRSRGTPTRRRCPRETRFHSARALMGRCDDRVPQVDEGLARVSPELRGDREVIRGRHRVRRESVAGRSAGRRIRACRGDQVRERH